MRHSPPTCKVQGSNPSPDLYLESFLLTPDGLDCINDTGINLLKCFKATYKFKAPVVYWGGVLATSQVDGCNLRPEIKVGKLLSAH